jgi:hypothetical protein
MAPTLILVGQLERPGRERPEILTKVRVPVEGAWRFSFLVKSRDKLIGGNTGGKGDYCTACMVERRARLVGNESE